jgi:transposase InsO family protein
VKSQDVVPSIQLEEADGCDAFSSCQEDRVDTHKNAPMTPVGRLRMVEAVLAGETIQAVAQRGRTDRKTVRKWVNRYRAERAAGLCDRSSRPHHSPTAIARGTAQRVITLRQRRWTMASIAAELRLSRATVSRVLARAGLSRLAALDPAPLPRRYERARPGELLHIDSKKLACIQRTGHRVTGDPRDHVRGAGWEAAFVAIDDRSRVGFAEMFADERKRSAAAFLDHAARYYRDLGVRVRCIMTDNAKVFRSLSFVAACRRWRLRHIFTKFYTPRTNGKAERFIQTALREWAYGRTYRHSRERTAYLPDWLHRYNWHRPHSALAGRPPISRLSIAGDNLLRLHT